MLPEQQGFTCHSPSYNTVQMGSALKTHTVCW